MFRKKLIKLMSDMHISQSELATTSGLTKASISQYVNGKNRPKGKSLEAIAKTLDVPEAYLTDDTAGELPEQHTALPRMLTPAQTGKLMGACAQMVRVNMQNGKLPFGYALRGTESGKYTYYIYTKLVMEHIGATEEDVLGVL